MAKRSVSPEEIVGQVLESEHIDVLREILAKALAEIMEAEVQDLCGAKWHERSSARQSSRNGYRERAFETRLGSIPLAIPRIRKGSYFPGFLEPRRRWEQAFVNVVSEAYVQGLSTRKVEDLIEAMGAKGISKSEVSRISAILDAQVEDFRNRPLTKNFPYVWLDALYVKGREGGRIVSKAVLTATGVSETGEREILGVQVAESEMEGAWKQFLEHLLHRGLRGVQLVISDAHTGLKRAVTTTLTGTAWQRCTVHFHRNMLAAVPRSAQGIVSAAVKNIFKQATLRDAKEAAGKALTAIGKKFPKAAALIRDAEEDVLAFMSFPEKHWRQIHSTNLLERLNREIRRRTDVVGIFPSDVSMIRLIGMLLSEQNDEWAVGRRYFSLESMAALNQSSTTALEAA